MSLFLDPECSGPDCQAHFLVMHLRSFFDSLLAPLAHRLRYYIKHLPGSIAIIRTLHNSYGIIMNPF